MSCGLCNQQRDFAAIYSDVPGDGTAKRLSARVEFSDEVNVDTAAGPRSVAAVVGELELFVRHSWVPMKFTHASDYADPKAVVAQAVSYSASALFSVQATTIIKADTGEAVLSLQLTPNRNAKKG